MAIEYQVEETLTTANGCTCDKTGKQPVANGGSVTFTNSYTPETIEKEIVKVWDDNNDQDGIRPASVEVVLTGSDGSERKVTLDGTADTAPTGTDPAGYESEGSI